MVRITVEIDTDDINSWEVDYIVEAIEQAPVDIDYDVDIEVV